MAIQVQLKDFSKVLEEFSGKHLSEIKQGVVAGIQKSIPDLVKASPVDQGYYAASWAMTVDEEKATIGNYAPHAPIIEWGARPFRPPLPPLLAWAKRVLKDPSQPPKYSDRVWALAKHTQAKIEQVGIAPRHVLENALPMIIENIREELANGGS